MTGPQRYRAAATLLLVGATAEAARRLLIPRRPTRQPVPVDIRDHFSPAEIERGRSYARPQRRLAVLGSALDSAAVGYLAVRPPTWLRQAARRPVSGGAAAGAALAAGLMLPTLPLSAISRRRAIAVGLDTQSWADWARDLIKAGALQAGFAAGAGAAVIAATRRWPRSWWRPAAAGSVLFGAGLAALAPVLLAPLFNDFTPLPDGETRDDVLALAAAAGVEVGEVYSIDASRRTTAANAYVTGLGPTKRIVLFDTLLDRYSRDEIRMVVAHELGHVRHRDVLRNLAFAALVAPATALAAQRLSWALSPERGTPATLPCLALAAGIAGAPVGVIANRLSRAVERQADEYALELAGAPEAFVSFERTIALQNVADLEPPVWVRRLMASHPPTDERIGAALAFAAAAGAPPA